MHFRTRGWAGLVVVAIGLAVVAASHFVGPTAVASLGADKPASSAAMAPIVLDAAPSGAPAASAAVAGPVPMAAQPPATPAADQRFVIKRILPIKGPIRYGDWHWDEAGVPAGPLVITVDLDARVLSVFRNGYEIAATAVLLGTTEKPTPTGLFPITQKDADHAPVPPLEVLDSHTPVAPGAYARRGAH